MIRTPHAWCLVPTGKLFPDPDVFLILANGYTLSIGGTMPGIPLSDNLVIGMVDQSDSLKTDGSFVRAAESD